MNEIVFTAYGKTGTTLSFQWKKEDRRGDTIEGTMVYHRPHENRTFKLPCKLNVEDAREALK